MTAGTVATITEVGICNLALLRIADQNQIASFADGTPEANACALLYPTTRDLMLREFPWPWATGYQQLAQVGGPEINGLSESVRWSRSYRYPSDCLTLRAVVITPQDASASSGQTAYIGSFIDLSSRRPEGGALPIPYRESSDSIGRLIETDAYGSYGVTAVYTRAVNDPSQFAQDFADALSWRIAADLAVSLGYNDTRRSFATEMAEKMTQHARANAMNAQQSDIPWSRRMSQATRARWG